MLIRLKVKGYKNLAEVDVRFGPLTCIVGPNNAGKSNLLDAIGFLGAMASMPISAAAATIKGSIGNVAVSSLFTSTHGWRSEWIDFQADFLVPQTCSVGAGLTHPLPCTALSYAVRLRFVSARQGQPDEVLVESESLVALTGEELAGALEFATSPEFSEEFLASAKQSLFLTMDDAHPGTLLVHGEGAGAVPKPVRISGSPRTFISSCGPAGHAAVLAAKREMQSWSVFHLEPSALRRADDEPAGGAMSRTGFRLASAVEALNRNEALAYRLSGLIPGLVDIAVGVDSDSGRREIELHMIDGARVRARSLSDGTLRLLALAVIALDSKAAGVLCIDEPENGMHPASLNLVVELFSEAAVDTAFPVDSDNPLRQIIFCTHSPNVVQALQVDDLLVAQTYKYDGAELSLFSPMAGSWRARAACKKGRGAVPEVYFGALMAYLGGGDAELLSSSRGPGILQAFRSSAVPPP